MMANPHRSLRVLAVAAAGAFLLSTTTACTATDTATEATPTRTASDTPTPTPQPQPTSLPVPTLAAFTPPIAFAESGSLLLLPSDFTPNTRGTVADAPVALAGTSLFVTGTAVARIDVESGRALWQDDLSDLRGESAATPTKPVVTADGTTVWVAMAVASVSAAEQTEGDPAHAPAVVVPGAEATPDLTEPTADSQPSAAADDPGVVLIGYNAVTGDRRTLATAVPSASAASVLDQRVSLDQLSDGSLLVGLSPRGGGVSWTWSVDADGATRWAQDGKFAGEAGDVVIMRLSGLAGEPYPQVGGLDRATGKVLWNRAGEDEAATDAWAFPVGAETALTTVSYATTRTVTRMIDPRTGQDLGGAASTVERPLLQGGRLYDAQSGFRSLDPATLSTEWTRRSAGYGSVRGVVLAQGLVYGVDSADQGIILDPESGERIADELAWEWLAVNEYGAVVVNTAGTVSAADDTYWFHPAVAPPAEG
jgi:outer membrane protein assembly factor BamB